MKDTTSAELSALGEDTQETQDTQDQVETQEVSTQVSEPSDDHTVDPFENVERKQVSIEDLEEIEWAASDDPDSPANKGAVPIHVLDQQGLLDENVKAHIKEFRRGYTQSKQEAAALRKELESLKANKEEEPETSTPSEMYVVVPEEDYDQTKTLAETKVTREQLATKEGIQQAIEIEAAKKMLAFYDKQRELADQQVAQQQEAQAVQTAKAKAKEFITENPWINDPRYKEQVVKLVKQGASLYEAAYEVNKTRNKTTNSASKQVPSAVRTGTGRSASPVPELTDDQFKNMSGVEILRYYQNRSQ